MIKNLLISILFLASGMNLAQAQNTWTQKADFGGTGIAAATGFSIGSKGYIGTGSDFYNYLKGFWEYDPATDAWTQKADVGGTGRDYAVGFSIGNKGYIGTGEFFDGSFHFYNDFWEYDPLSNVWTKKADFGGAGRANAVGFSIGNKGYIGTGYFYDGSDHFFKDFWEYDPDTDTWTQKADFGGTARFSPVGFSIGDKGYVGTGFDGTPFPDYLKKDFWEYDPAINSWKQKADFGGTARYVATGFSIDSKGYIGTGWDGFG
ncbi:MAG TPA: hypothetical protein PLD84_15450, partial [Chitinophagales bacterium]|nr:hypothetical protein [Chitinophagales bacterium]